MRYIYLSLLLIAALLELSCNGPKKAEVAGENTPSTSSVEVVKSVAISEDDIPMLIGTYTRKEGHVNGKAKGIHLAYLNPSTGYMRHSGTYEAGVNPSYLAIHPTRDFAYAVNETGGTPTEQWGSITSLKVNEDKSLEILNTKSTEGIAPCHISFNTQGTHLMIANYVSGSVTSFTTGLDGKLSQAQNIVRYKGQGKTGRQKSPHAHYINQLKDGLVVTADLGTDSIRFHDFGSSQLENASGVFATKAGAGPRHIVTHPNLGLHYIINELDATITSIRKNTSDIYQEFQSISTRPEGDERQADCAAIKITPDGRYLYATNRGDYNNIAIYSVDQKGKLELISHQSSLGNVPRDMEISPEGDFLIVANQNSDNLVSFKIDQTTGLLKNPKILEGVATPVCVKFFMPRDEQQKDIKTKVN